MLRPGAQLQGRYTIEKIIGRGGMGCVYVAAEETLGGKRVAIKEMHVDIDDEEERTQAFKQFEDEAKIIARLDHPGLVAVTHYFVETERGYLVMEFIDGVTLETLYNSSPTYLEVARVMGWTDQLCDVLQYLHSHSPPIIFRDMKPSNIMLDRYGRIRLIDFGIARTLGPASRTATFIKGAGTHGFAPIEQYGQGVTDARSDIYALGATIYTLLTRRLPPASVDLAPRPLDLRAPSAINPAIPKKLDVILLKMMAMAKEDRYQTVDEVRQVLRQTWMNVQALQRSCRVCHAFALPTMTQCPECGGDFEEMEQRPPVPGAPGASTNPTGHPTVNVAVESAQLPSDTELPSTTTSVAAARTRRDATGTVLVQQPPAVPPRPAARANMTPLLIAVVILLGLVGFILRPRPAPPPSATLHISSQPAGAAVVVDGRAYGETPVSVPGLTVGVHTVELQMKQYMAETVKLDIKSEGADKPLKVQLLPRPQELTGTFWEEASAAKLHVQMQPQGSIVLRIHPPGGDLWIDGVKTASGVKHGETLAVPSGQHEMEYTLDGYESISQTIHVPTDRPLDVKATLKKGGGG